MGTLLRRCRGALGIGALWGAAWAAIFAAVVLIVGVFDPDSIDRGEGPIEAARIGGVVGFVSGAVFAMLLSLADGRKTIRDLSVGRAALWGMLGAAAIPLLTPANDDLVLVLCPIGAALAAASVAAAKRAELHAPPEQQKLPS